MRVRRKVILIFGESDNDRRSLGIIIRCILADYPDIKIELRSKPLVLLSAAERKETRRKVSEEISRLVAAARVTHDVIAVIAHRDCDEVEPAHEQIARAIEEELVREGVERPIAAAPAWEIETWWMQFPEAIAATRKCWRQVDYSSRNVGMISNAKEVLIRDLRPTESKLKAKCPDYVESDSIQISTNICALSKEKNTDRRLCQSFVQFTQKIDALKQYC